MKLDLSTTIGVVLSDSQKDNTMKIVNSILAGSSKDFDTASQDETIALFNDFSVKEIERKDFELLNGNTFSLEIFSMLKSLPEDVAFIHISCYEASDPKKSTPLRFQVIIGDGSHTINMGKMSQLTMLDFKSSLITSLTISNIIVPNVPNANPTKAAILSIIVGSKTKYST